MTFFIYKYHFVGKAINLKTTLILTESYHASISENSETILAKLQLKLTFYLQLLKWCAYHKKIPYNR